MIEVLYGSPASLEEPRSPCNREEHRAKDHARTNGVAGGKRTPRRAQTQHEYFLPPSPAFTIFTVPPSPPQHQPAATEPDGAKSPSATPACTKEPDRGRRPARRPPLGPPRRSYSVTDQQPIPRRHNQQHHHHHQGGGGHLTLTDLPAELHLAIMDFLDPIDSVCLGLTAKHFYALHRRLHGAVPLTARRDGPNDLEWAWHLAGNTVRRQQQQNSPAGGLLKGLGEAEKHALSRLRVRGQGYCRMCGVTRCQLHKHVQEWMGGGLEYCEVRRRFGPVAPQGAKSYCYMSRPGDVRRCGRHGMGGGGRVELR